MTNSARSLEAFVAKISADPFAQLLGIQVVQVEPGKTTIQMMVDPKMANFHGTPHGGAIFTLADTALAIASNSHGTAAVALDVSISYCRPAPLGGILTAVAVEENLTRNTGLYAISIYGENEKLIASAKGTVFRTGKPILT